MRSGVAPPADTASLAERRLVVTGGTGFVGSAFVRRAVGDGASVAIVARPTADHWRLEPVASGYETIAMSLAELGEARRREPVDVIVHFAAAGVNQAFDDVDELIETNVVGTAQVVQFAIRSHASRLVLIGTSAEYGPGEALVETAPLAPTSEYGATRAAATLIARASGARRGLDVVVVRPFAVYGPYEAPYRLIPYVILRSLRDQQIEISSGVQTRDWVHVDDVCDGIARASLSPEATGGVFNLCTGTSTTVREATVLAAELAGGSLEISREARKDIPGEMWRTSGDPRRALEVLGWSTPRPFGDGLRHTVDWFRAQGQQLASYR